MNFLQHYFKDADQLLKAHQPLAYLEEKSKYIGLIEGMDFKDGYKVLNQFVRDRGTFIPPLMSIYMNLSPTMRAFDTAINEEFGAVEETAILVTIEDIYQEKKERHLEF